jgi:DNA primase
VAREASADPIKKAEAIRDVLQSIAKVPDGLKRQVFLQQTASVFGFDEQVIITEYNKLLKSNSPAKAKHSETRDENSSATQASIPAQAFSPQEEAEMAMYGISSGSESESKIEHKPAIDTDLGVLQDCEYGVLRLLILYGPYELSEGLSVAYFLLDQLDGVEFSSEVYSKIWAEYHRAIASGQALDARQFMQYPDPEVRSLVAGFATDTIEPSANWRIKDIYIPNEINMILPLCENAVMRLNLCHAERELKRIDKILRTPNLSIEEANNVLVAQIQTKKVIVELGKRLGNVVPRSMQF